MLANISGFGADFGCVKTQSQATSLFSAPSDDGPYAIDRFRRKEGREIKPLTVREILDEEIGRMSS